MTVAAFDPILDDEEAATAGAGSAIPAIATDAPASAPAAVVEAADAGPSPAAVGLPDTEPPEQPLGAQDLQITAWSEDRWTGAPAHLATGVTNAMEADGVDAAQILRDHPDVYAGFFTAYYGPNNDRHSSAWVDRVGGDTPEAYAKYWYNVLGGGAQHAAAASAAAPAEEGSTSEASFAGRTTADGVYVSQILHDRPDVFRAFFSSYYGPNNDHHSNAWHDRVGGETVEDFANYWYEHFGKAEGYAPSTPPSAAAASELISGEVISGEAPDTDPAAPATAEQLIVDTTVLETNLGAAAEPAAPDPSAGLDPEAFLAGRQLLDPSDWVI